MGTKVRSPCQGTAHIPLWRETESSQACPVPGTDGLALRRQPQPQAGWDGLTEPGAKGPSRNLPQGAPPYALQNFRKMPWCSGSCPAKQHCRGHRGAAPALEDRAKEGSLPGLAFEPIPHQAETSSGLEDRRGRDKTQSGSDIGS